VLILSHHEGYISWSEYERNQRLIADNANSKGLMVRGAVRKGEALLAGLLRCGHCSCMSPTVALTAVRRATIAKAPT
jgi:hypothetical protein